MDRLPKLRRRPKIVTPEVAVTSIASPATATAPDYIASFTPISPTSSPLALPSSGPNGPSPSVPTLKSAASDSALGAAVTVRRTRHTVVSNVSTASNFSSSHNPARPAGIRDSSGSLIPTPAYLTARNRVPSAPSSVVAAQAKRTIESLPSANSSRSSLVLSNAAAAGSQIPLPVSVTSTPSKPALVNPPTIDTAAAIAASQPDPPAAAPSITTTTASPASVKVSRTSRLPSAFRSLPFRGPMKRSRSPAPPPISTSGAHFANPSITAIAVAATPSPSAAAPALMALGHNLEFSSPSSAISSPRSKSGHHRKVSSKSKFSVAGTAFKNHFAAAQASWSPLLGKSRHSMSASVSGLHTPSPKGAKMPPFMSSSIRDVQAKFNELTWIERNRVAFGCKRARKARANSPPRPTTSATCAPSGFEQLSRKPSYRHPEPAQQGLDRYINIQPWNHNRITLDVPKDTQDYVNASPIILSSAGDPNGLPDLKYIAMQGPTEMSTPYVWRMISEKLDSEAVIVQLTNLVENLQVKCHAYFPLDQQEGDMSINNEDIWKDGWRAKLKFDTIEVLAEGSIEFRKLILTVTQPVIEGGEEAKKDETKMKKSAKSGNPKASLVSVMEEYDAEEEVAESVEVKKSEATSESVVESVETNIETKESSESAPTDVSAEASSTPISSSPDATPEAFAVTTRTFTIYHLFYTRWPDFGVPAPDDIPSFIYLMELSRQYNHIPSNPRIIHCSAGVGRTGTFIALEHLKRELDNGFLLGDDPFAWGASSGSQQEDMSPVTPGAVDTRGDLIFSTVDALREQRKLMVQSEAQYVFLYQVLRRLWRDRYGLSEEDVAERAAKRQELESEIKG